MSEKRRFDGTDLLRVVLAVCGLVAALCGKDPDWFIILLIWSFWFL